MQAITRKKFFEHYRAEFKSLNQRQVDALEQLLAFLEGDSQIEDIRWAAYILATSKHETANTFLPVHEFGSRKYFISRYGSQTTIGRRLGNDTPEEGALYAGRGFPQTTGESNYERLEVALRREYPEVVEEFERRTGRKFDLTVGDQPDDESDPDNMLDAHIAYASMSYGMRTGLFTGKDLDDYINETICDYGRARKIINGTDRAELIAGYARSFERTLKASIETEQAADSLGRDTANVEVSPSPAPVAVPVNSLAPAVPIVSTPQDAPAQASQGGAKSLLATVSANIAAIGTAAYAILKDNAELLKWALIVAGAGLAVYLVRQIVLDYLRIKTASDPSQYNAK